MAFYLSYRLGLALRFVAVGLRYSKEHFCQVASYVNNCMKEVVFSCYC